MKYFYRIFHGSHLILKDKSTHGSVTETRFQPTVANESAPSADNAIQFLFRPYPGLKFTPTKVSAKATRFGTDGGKLDFAWINPDGTTVSLATEQVANRNNKSDAPSDFAFDVTGATVAEGECGLLINLYSLGDTKQVGFADIVIEGTLSGEKQEIPILASFKANGTEYNVEDIFEIVGDDYVANIELFKADNMISQNNPLTDVTAKAGTVGTITYAGDDQKTTVTIPVTHNNITMKWVANFVRKPFYTLTYIDTDGKTVITLGKDIKRCYAFHKEGYSLIENVDGKSGLIDTKGKMLIKPVYQTLGVYSDGLLLTIKDKEDNVLTIMDTKGQKLGGINLEKYEMMTWAFDEGKIIAKNKDDEDGYCIVLDKTGTKLFDIKKAKKLGFGDIYKGGYMTFANSDDKHGVADDKGEIVIRPKYEDLWNFGNGHFAAKKGDKWGIVNDKDETVIDFDYDDWGIRRMGSNYVMKDGSSWCMIGLDGKEITSFDVYGYSSDSYAEYVDVEGLANGLLTSIEGYEQPKSAAEKAKQHSLSVDDFHYRSYISENETISDKIKGNLEISYDGALAEEKTHTEKVDDGWFTYDRTVSDGYQWAKVLPESVTATLNINDNAIDTEILYRSLCSKLANGRTKILDGVFSKKVNVNGKTLKCQTQLDNRDSEIGLIIAFFAE